MKKYSNCILTIFYDARKMRAHEQKPSLGEVMDCTQAAAPKRRETPRSRLGKVGIRLCSKWLGSHDPYDSPSPKLNQWGPTRRKPWSSLLSINLLPPWLRMGGVFICTLRC